MIPRIEALTTAALSAALDGASRNQAAIAANIANANTLDYVALGVSFDDQVAQARATLRDGGALDPSVIPSLRGELAPRPGADGAPAKVQVDVEMAELARNAVHFQALAQALSRHLGLQALAAADGRK